MALHRCCSKFSAADAAIAWIPRSFWPSPYASFCTAHSVLYVQMYTSAQLGVVDACPSTTSPSASQRCTLCERGSSRTDFCGLLAQESTRPEVTDGFPAVPPLTGHKPCVTACLLIALHYLHCTIRKHNGPGKFPREPGNITCTLHSCPGLKKRGQETPCTFRGQGEPACRAMAT